MKNQTRELIKFYKLKKYDFMGFQLIKSQATYHHIVKREDGGLCTLDNGAVLMPNNHRYLHIIECKDLEIYILINKILKIINERQEPPTEYDFKYISELLSWFEEKHKDDVNAKGKKLIKHSYLTRDF